MNINIEQAKPEHAERICHIRDTARIDAYPNEELGITAEDVRLNSQGKDGVFTPRIVKALTEELSEKDNPSRMTYVAKETGELIGYVAASIEDSGRGNIYQIYVLPEHQGSGIGNELLTHALSWLGDDKEIYLEVVSYNDRAIKFYEKFGFLVTDNPIEEEQGRPDYMIDIPHVEMVRPKAKSTISQ